MKLKNYSPDWEALLLAGTPEAEGKLKQTFNAEPSSGSLTGGMARASVVFEVSC